MKVKVFFVVITFFMLSVDAMAKIDARSWVESKGRFLIETFGEPDVYVKYERLDTLLLEDVDLEYISKFVMGKYYKEMSDAQRQKYQKAFKNYALYTYKKFPLSFGQKINFYVDNVSSLKTFVNVKTLIWVNPETKFNIEFVLKPVADSFKIVDIKIGESSLILSYRTRFYEMIAQNDGEIDWFIEDLENITKDENGV